MATTRPPTLTARSMATYVVTALWWSTGSWCARSGAAYGLRPVKFRSRCWSGASAATVPLRSRPEDSDLGDERRHGLHGLPGGDDQALGAEGSSPPVARATSRNRGSR